MLEYYDFRYVYLRGTYFSTEEGSGYFKDRVNNYRDANTKVLSKKLKNGNFNRTHSGITSDAINSHR